MDTCVCACMCVIEIEEREGGRGERKGVCVCEGTVASYLETVMRGQWKVVWEWL